MNRPAARNTLTSSLIEALYTALAESDADPSVRAVVLTGLPGLAITRTGL